MRTWLRLSFFVLAIFSAFWSSVEAEQFYASDPMVVELDRLYRLSGRVFPVDAFPVSEDGLRTAARALRPRGQATSSAIERYLDALPNRRDSLKAEYAATLEGRFYSSSTAVETSGHPAEASSKGIDFRRNYLERPAFADLSLSAESTMGFEIVSSAELRREWNGNLFSIGNIPDLAFDGGEGDFENHFFTRGVFSWQTEGFRTALGRDTLRLGGPRGSSLYPSDILPFLDSFSLRAPFGPVSMDWIVASIHSFKSSARDVDPNETYPGYAGDPSNPYGFEGDENPTAIIFAAHRFGLDLGRVRLSFGSEVLYARRNNAYQLADFFPVFTWHNGDLRINNIALILGARWVPLPGLELSLEAGYDDISAKAVGVGDHDIPTIDAYIAKATYSRKLPWGWLDLFAEAGYTHYLWGNFDAYATGIDDKYVVPLAKALYRYRIDGGYGAALLPLTSPYGPGALWISFDGSTEWGRFRLGASMLALSLNSESDSIDTDYEESETIENAPRSIYWEIALSATYRFAFFEASVSPGIFTKDGKLGARVFLGLRAGGASKYVVR